MNNNSISQFSFWQPVAFKDVTPSTNQLQDLFWKIGSVADEFAYIGSQEAARIYVQAERVNVRKFSFEQVLSEPLPMWDTAIKLTLSALTLFTLPLLALAIKVMYKWRLNAITMVKDNPNQFLAGKEIGKTQIVLATGNLLDETTDVVVNAANARLAAGGGICGAFYKNAGKGIFDECNNILNDNKIKAIQTGQAVMTTAGDLRPRIKAIVHAVGPIYDKKKADKVDYPKQLEMAYISSMKLAAEPDEDIAMVSSELQNPQPMRTIGFPSISTGIYDFPLDLAAATALGAVKKFIEANPDALDEVRFVFFPIDKDPQETATFYVDALNDL